MNNLIDRALKVGFKIDEKGMIHNNDDISSCWCAEWKPEIYNNKQVYVPHWLEDRVMALESNLFRNFNQLNHELIEKTKELILQDIEDDFYCFMEGIQRLNKEDANWILPEKTVNYIIACYNMTNLLPRIDELENGEQ